MVQFTTAERMFMVEQLNQTNNTTKTRINYKIEFSNGRVPSRKAIRLNVLKYHQHGTSLNRNRVNLGDRGLLELLAISVTFRETLNRIHG